MGPCDFLRTGKRKEEMLKLLELSIFFTNTIIIECVATKRTDKYFFIVCSVSFALLLMCCHVKLEWERPCKNTIFFSLTR